MDNKVFELNSAEFNWFFQDNDAKANPACVVQDQLQWCRITALPWPVKSSDLSPIEHLWDILWRHAWRQPHIPHNINKLTDALKKKWHVIQAVKEFAHVCERIFDWVLYREDERILCLCTIGHNVSSDQFPILCY